MADSIATDRQKDQLEYMQRWLRYAPTPPVRGSNSYDVFISYRSLDRAWAMALFDVLKLAGWKAFLDQYDLIPGSELETSLAEALEASSSGVILWSSRHKDSEWCKKERLAMSKLKSRAFKYIFAKLDAEPLPLFAAADLYVDFEDSPEGPRGVRLLDLLCGMKGVERAPEAVVLAQEVDQNAKTTMVAVKGAIEAGNATRLVEIGTSAQPGVLASPGPVLAVAQGLIRMGECELARTVLVHARAHFPESIRAKQLEGLALRRLERYQEAVDVLSELKAAGHQDPETMGMLAAAWDGLYLGSKKKLHLRTSRELYRTAFERDPQNYYTGINAAAKSLFLGETEEANRLVAQVLALPTLAKDVAADDLYGGCTQAEGYLLQRKLDAAAAQYEKMIDKHPTKKGDLQGTGRQAARICAALDLSSEETAKVLAPFKLLDD